ncbi:Hypothetical predicted protein [Drosophila guanche]|uniref:Uncharacterized protein n=1 Tax=Drosophila guanche TaxID=7266 RepID=A0A3B0JQK6_DROGU|nr:Hypothetical predicted protein [Drosophila guanche]
MEVYVCPAPATTTITDEPIANGQPQLELQPTQAESQPETHTKIQTHTQTESRSFRCHQEIESSWRYHSTDLC